MTGLPDGWVWSTLGAASDHSQYGFTTRAAAVGELHFLRTTDITSGQIDWDKVPFCEDLPDDAQKYLLDDGDVVISRAGSVGFSHMVQKPRRAVFASYLIRFRPRIFQKYFAYFLKTSAYWQQISDSQAGIAVPNVNAVKLSQIELPIAPLPEQHRIVAKIEELFSELDAGTASLTRARAQLKTYRQALLKAAFEGKLTAPWRAANPDKLEAPETLLSRIRKERDTRFAAALDGWQTALSEWRAGGEVGRKPGKPSFPRDFRDDLNDIEIVLTELPLGWAWGRLGFATCGVEYGTSAKSSNDGDVPVIRMGNLQNGAIDWSDLAFTSDLEEIEKYALDANDVLFNRTNSPELVGKTAIYRGDRPALFAGYLIRINQIDSTVLPEFLCYFLNSHTARKHGDTVKTDGVNQSNINGNKLQEYPFPFCSLEEQMEIVANLDAKLSSVDAIESEIATALTRITALRQSILKKAFSGQLVPQNPADEPASALLARLAQAPAPKPRRKTKP